MTTDDEQCLKLGREMVRMIHELRTLSDGDRGFTSRRFTYPGGEVYLILANHAEVAYFMEDAARRKYNVETVTPRLKDGDL